MLPGLFFTPKPIQLFSSFRCDSAVLFTGKNASVLIVTGSATLMYLLKKFYDLYAYTAETASRERTHFTQAFDWNAARNVKTLNH